jgi:hypothetical protein
MSCKLVNVAEAREREKKRCRVGDLGEGGWRQKLKVERTDGGGKMKRSGNNIYYPTHTQCTPPTD